MDPAEYAIMRQVEDEHWWYGGLRGILSQTIEKHAPPNARDILDIGCGTGANLALLNENYRVTGLDREPLALQHSRERGPYPLTLGSALELPFETESFDAVTMMDVLYHAGVDPPEQALAEAARILKPGGIFLANVPAYNWLRSSHDEHIHTARRFTRPRLLDLIRAGGLDPIHCTYWNTLLFPAVAAVRILRKTGGHEASDLAGYRPSLSGSLCAACLTLERAAIRIAPLPFGVSIFAVARKPG